jgi:hypothetical protein
VGSRFPATKHLGVLEGMPGKKNDSCVPLRSSDRRHILKSQFSAILLAGPCLEKRPGIQISDIEESHGFFGRANDS